MILNVKPSFALIAAGLALLAGCGQPGPLYMPKPPAKPVPAPPVLTPPATGSQVNPSPVAPSSSPSPDPSSVPTQ